MDVEDAVGKRLEQRRADQPHESGEADQVDAAGAQRVGERRDRRRRGRDSRADRDTRVSMPAARARARPGGVGRFEIDDAIVASSAPRRDRVDDRLQIAAAAGDQDAEPAASRRVRVVARPRSPATTVADDATRAGLAGARQQRRARARRRRGAHDDDQADAHVERAEHLVARDARRAAAAAGRAAARPTRADRSRPRSPSGRMRGRFSVMPPPVMCAMPLTSPRSSSGRTSAQIRPVRREQRVADGRAELRHERVGAAARHARTARGARASSRWCAGRTTAGRSARRRARCVRPSMTPRPLDDADDEAGDVVLAVGVEARHLGGLAAEQRAAVLAARRARRRRRPARRRRATAGRSPGSRGRTAARAPCTRMSLTQWFTRSAPTVSCRPVMNATFSFVPTPSALDTSTGSRYAVAVEPEQAAERPDVGQHARREGAARERLDAADGLVAGVDVDAGLPVVHQKSSLPISVCISAARRRAVGARPSRSRRTTAKNRSLSRSSSSMSKPSASSVDRAASRSGAARAAVSISGVLRSATVASASATGARVGSRDGMPTSNSASTRRRRGRRRRARRGPAAAPRSSSWKPGFWSANFSVSTR